MKILNNIIQTISTVDGYKSQFVSNDLPNILFVDPVLSSHDYYTMIFPAIAINTFEVANISFTNISKYVESEDRLPYQNISAHEIAWANVIVFPHTICEYMDGENHLFDSIKNINPNVQILLVVENNYKDLLFSKEVISEIQQTIPDKIDLDLKRKIHQKIIQDIEKNIQKCDRIIVHSQFLKNILISNFTSNKIEKEIKVIPVYNHEDMIKEGFETVKKINRFRDPHKINIFVDFIDVASANSFLKNVIEKSPEYVRFYSRNTSIRHEKLYRLKKATITHWYKELKQYSFDYFIISGKSNSFLKTKFIAGSIIDICLFGNVPIITSSSLYDVQPDQLKPLILNLNESKILNLILENDFDFRVKKGILSYEGALIDFNATEAIKSEYSSVFLNI